jgi:hypothetical protein
MRGIGSGRRGLPVRPLAPGFQFLDRFANVDELFHYHHAGHRLARIYAVARAADHGVAIMGHHDPPVLGRILENTGIRTLYQVA